VCSTAHGACQSCCSSRFMLPVVVTCSSVLLYLLSQLFTSDGDRHAHPRMSVARMKRARHELAQTKTQPSHKK